MQFQHNAIRICMTCDKVQLVRAGHNTGAIRKSVNKYDYTLQGFNISK